MAKADTGTALLAWLFAGAATVIGYANITGRNWREVLTGVDLPDTDSSSGFASNGISFPGKLGDSFSSEIVRVRAVANRETPPNLVPILPCGALDSVAAASKNRIDKALGFTVRPASCGDTIRDYAAQARSYASDPNRFGSPDKSLHVVGLAFDIHAEDLANPAVKEAFRAEGWQFPVENEPWHASYLVRG